MLKKAPSKNACKLWYIRDMPSVVVEVRLPVKQGLKHEKAKKVKRYTLKDWSKTSSKTRIETIGKEEGTPQKKFVEVRLKPGYNIQFGVDAEYIVWISAGPQPTDTTTLIPFLDSIKSHLKYTYKNIVADSGYESEENYVYLEENNQHTFIKPSNYEISKRRKYKTDISLKENMSYDKENDFYICSNGKKLEVTGTKLSKSKTGYISKKTCYTCEDCNGCSLKSKCIKGSSKKPLEERTKRLEISKLFQQKREEALERILSDEGTELRMNRSIQAEGAFGEIKQDMGFRRFLCKGKKNILAECILLGLAHNVNKLHNKIQSERCSTYLHPLKTA